MSSEATQSEGNYQKILYWIHGARASVRLDYNDVFSRLSGLFDQGRFQTRDQFQTNSRLDSIRGCIVVIVAGACTCEDINRIVQCGHVDSLFIYDPYQESTDAVLSFGTAKFQGIFLNRNELVDRICRQYFTARPATAISGKPDDHLQAILDTMQNMQISTTEHGEQVSIID